MGISGETGIAVQQAVLERPGVVQVTTGVQVPVEPGQALVRLRVAGICGSDLAAFRGTSPHIRYPRVLGHELLVDVLACLERSELVGRRAVVDPILRCGHCRACRAGRYNCCLNLQTMGVHVDGGMREVFTVASGRLFAVPEDMPDEVAVLAEPLTVAYHAVQRAGMEAGQTAVVIGAGPIGLLIAQLLVRARGCRALVVDIDDERLAVVQRLGATSLRGDEATLYEAVDRATEGGMAHAVFEATGNAGCTRMTTELVGHGGRIVLVGWNERPVEMDTVTLMRKEVDLLGSRNSVNAFPAVLQILADGLIDTAALVTHRFPLDQVAAALQALDQGQSQALKILIDAPS